MASYNMDIVRPGSPDKKKGTAPKRDAQQEKGKLCFD